MSNPNDWRQESLLTSNGMAMTQTSQLSEVAIKPDERVDADQWKPP